MKNGLELAKKANVPVVAIESKDCEGDPLFSHVVTYGDDGESFTDFFKKWGRAQGVYAIKESNFAATTAVVDETDLFVSSVTRSGIEDAFKDCADCKIKRLPITIADVGPQIQQKVSQFIIKNPDINSIIVPYDALLTLGGAAALQSTGRDFVIVGGEGSQAGISSIRQGKIDACVGIPTRWEGFAASDALARMFADLDPTEASSGIGIQICDKDNNLPSGDSGYVPPIDYEKAYDSIWQAE